MHTQTRSVRSIHSTQDGIIGAKRASVVIQLRKIVLYVDYCSAVDKKVTEVYTLTFMKAKQHFWGELAYRLLAE